MGAVCKMLCVLCVVCIMSVRIFVWLEVTEEGPVVRNVLTNNGGFVLPRGERQIFKLSVCLSVCLSVSLSLSLSLSLYLSFSLTECTSRTI